MELILTDNPKLLLTLKTDYGKVILINYRRFLDEKGMQKVWRNKAVRSVQDNLS